MHIYYNLFCGYSADFKSELIYQMNQCEWLLSASSFCIKWAKDDWIIIKLTDGYAQYRGEG